MIALLVKFEGDASKLEGRHIMKIVPFLDKLDTDPAVEIEAQVIQAPKGVARIFQRGDGGGWGKRGCEATERGGCVPSRGEFEHSYNYQIVFFAH